MPAAAPPNAAPNAAPNAVTGVGFAIVIVIVLVVVVATWAGVRLVEAVIGRALGALGPATNCGMEIAAKQRAYAAQGLPRCEAYAQAINAVAAAPRAPCPKPGGHPAAACGLYAEYLAAIGCAGAAGPRAPCAGS